LQSLSPKDRERLLSDEIVEPAPPEQDPVLLIRLKHFHEVVALLEPTVRAEAEPSIDNAFHLAMAYWALGEETEATQVGQKALNAFLGSEGVSQLLEVLDVTAENMVLLQELALLAFRADNLEVARSIAFVLLGDLDDYLFQGTSFFSYWRYRSVRFSQFREDCRNLQQMVRQRTANAPVALPPFLTTTLSGV
jgi:hypothetical protein